MEHDDQEVPRHDIDRAYDRWCALYGSSSFTPFWKFIGDDPFSASFRGRPHDYVLSNEGYRKLQMLLGPNYVAVIKAYKIQHKK